MVVSVAAALLIGACRSESTPAAAEEVIGWRPVGTWSGRGNVLTESFTSDTGGFRVHWQTSNEAPPGTGRFRAVFLSGDSGREIMEAANHRGVGRDTSYVGDRPRWYYLSVESANVDWSLTVEEPVIGQPAKP